MRDIDTFNQMISKNPEKRFAKNYDFVFGNSYLNDKDFKAAVNNFINNNESVYNAIYDKVVNKVDLGTSEQSARTFANMTEFIRQKENISIEELGNRITKNLTPTDIATNKEIYEHLGLNSSIWNKTTPKTQEEAIKKSTEKIKKLQQKLKRTGPQDPELDKLKTSKERLEYLKQKNKEVYKNSRQTFAKMTNRKHQENTIKNVQQSHIDDIKNELNNMDSKISELASKDPNHPDLINLKVQREALVDNLKRSEDALNNWVSYSNMPKLNPPREGAPMYEGLAVPSVIADTENFSSNVAQNNLEPIKINNTNNFKPEIPDNQINLNFINDQWMKQKQLEFSNREQQIKDEFSDLNQYDPNKISDPNYNSSIGAELLKNDIIDPIEWDTNDLNVSSFAIESQEIIDAAHEEALKMNTTFGNTVEETIENATKNVLEETVEAAGETIAKEVIEEGTEKILKEVTGINVELDGLNKKRTPKKLKKGTGKYKNKTGKQVYENSRYWGFDYNNGDDIFVHGTKKGTSRFDKKDLYKNDTNTRTNNTNNYADDIKKKLKEIDSWSDDYIRGLSEEDIINYSDNGEVFEKLYNRWNELNSSTNTNTNTNTSGDNKQTKQNKQKTKNAFDDYADWQKANDALDYTNPDNYYYTGNFKFDTNPETGIPNIDQMKRHTRNLEEIGYDAPNIIGIDKDGNFIWGDTRQVRPNLDVPNRMPGKTGLNKYLDDFKNMGFIEKVMTLGNVAGAVSDYKNARREGHGVVSSAIRAGTEFALGEALGMYYPLYLLAKEAPGLVIQGTEMLYKENRKMNSAANQQVFGGAQFQDTQQLATMRQSGMEMAKMAQYNLQQTLMGQEATYLHR